MLLLAKSKCGHDKDQIYVVYASDEEEHSVALVNGKNRGIDNPKKKKIKHIQLIKRPGPELETLYEEAQSVDDDLIRRILKLYHAQGEEEIV